LDEIVAGFMGVKLGKGFCSVILECSGVGIHMW
jgi:hypothetical protein